jgi:hypothetical protein
MPRFTKKNAADYSDQEVFLLVLAGVGWAYTTDADYRAELARAIGYFKETGDDRNVERFTVQLQEAPTRRQAQLLHERESKRVIASLLHSERGAFGGHDPHEIADLERRLTERERVIRELEGK